MIDHSQPVQRARDGVRSWVRSAGAGLRRASPYGVVAFLGAAAVAPVAGVALGASGAVEAALAQLGGMGSNFLANALVDAAHRAPDDPTDEQWRDAVAAELLTRLEAGDAGLRDELGSLLRAVGAVDVALREADDDMRHELAEAFGALGADVGRLHVLAEDAARSLAVLGIQQRQQTDLIRQSLFAAHQIQQELRRGIHRQRAAHEVGEDPGGPSPYPGMASFDMLDARFFRGRETLVAELLGRLSEQIVGGPPMVVVGVSGAGKSSLLRAGVLPAVASDQLGENSGRWPWLDLTPGAAPLAELTGRAAALAGADPELALAAVRKQPATFGELTAQIGPCVILVDQFEELFTQCTDPAERVAFTTALTAAAPALVIIVVRADFYPQCTELAPLTDMLAGQVVVGPPSASELRRAIREPAAIGGYTLEPGLEDLLLSDLGALGGGALPLLAHALRATWDRREGDTMTVAGYRATGGIARAVAETAERIFLDLDEEGRAALRRAMLALVTIVDDLPVRRRAARSETDLAPMIAARLVTAGENTVEISHEALLTGWPRLAGWLVEERQTILLRQRLELATADWVAAGEDRDALYRGARLDSAREWAAGQRDLPDAQRRFLAAGESAAHDRELARRRTNRRLRRLVAGMAVALLLVVAGGLVALWQQGKAEDSLAVAKSRQLAADTRTNLFFDELKADRSALNAWAESPTMEARSALIAAQQTWTIGQLGVEQAAYRISLSPDGGRVAVGYGDGRIQIWDAATLRQVGADLRHPAKKLIDLRFSPDGRYLAAGALSVKNGVAVWDAATGRMLRKLPATAGVGWLPDSSAVLAMRVDAFGPAGTLLGGWRPADGKLVSSTPIGVKAPATVAVSPDGAYIAAAGFGGAQVIRRSNGRVTFSRTNGTYIDAAFAPDGTLVTVMTPALPETRLESWDPATGRRIARLDSADRLVSPGRIAIGPDGTVLTQANRPSTIHRLTTDGAGFRVDFSLFRGIANAIAISADGRTLAMAGLESPPMLYRLDGGRLPHPSSVGSVAFDPGGGLIATQGFDPQVRLWNARTGMVTATVPLPGGAESSSGIAIGPDHTLVASAGDGRLLVFGPDGQLRHTLRAGPGQNARNPAISPDGSLVAATFNRLDKETLISGFRVWDLRSGALVGDVGAGALTAEHVVFSPDGRRIIATANWVRDDEDLAVSGPVGNGYVRQWQVPGFRPLDVAALPAGTRAADLAVSPDGATVVVAATNGRAALFRADLTAAGWIGSHAYPLQKIALSPDGRTLATASTAEGDPVRLWKVRGGELVAEVRGQNLRIDDLAFSPDGKILATAAGDWTVALHRLDPDDAVRLLCARLTPDIHANGGDLPRLCR